MLFRSGDGRDDLLLVVGGDGPMHVDLLHANRARKKPFARSTLFTADDSLPLPVSKLWVIAADVDYNGMSDLVLFRDLAADGTQILTLKASYGRLTLGISAVDASLDWTTLSPY